MAEEELNVKDPIPEPDVESGDNDTKDPVTTDKETLTKQVSPTGVAATDVPPTPPPKPKRPLSPFDEACVTLKEAFPDGDDNVIRAVIVASSGHIESAFNGMLALSDPSIKPDFSAGAAGARGTRGPAPVAAGGRQRSQIEEDEALARKLAQQFESGNERSSFSSSRRVRPSGYSGRYDDTRPAEPERSFFDDDLPEIKDNLQRGFQETRSKVSGWVTNMRKKWDQEDDQYGDDNKRGDRSGYGYDRAGRAPTNYYDRDPAEMTDDFQGISLRDEDGPRRGSRDAPRGPPPPKPPRPVMNAFGDESNKWEPLKSVNPEPVDKDPFFIGESEDEDEAEEGDKLKTDSKGEKKVSQD
jgi:CUE domain